MDYDYVIVGGGPAGAFFAYGVLQKNPQKRILLIERGERIENRSCPESKMHKCVKCKPFCNITNGFSGAGGGSDGKLSLYNPEDDDFYIGGNLHKYVGVNETKKLIDTVDTIYLKFGATKEVEGTEHRHEIDKIRKKARENGLDLLNVPIRHLGTDEAHKLYERLEHYLEQNGVQIDFNSEVIDLIVEENQVKGVRYKETFHLDIFEVRSSKVIVAVGRVGADWLLNMCKKHNIRNTPSVIDIGVRYELPDHVMEKLNQCMYEAKFVGKPAPFGDKVRTFCQNPSGFVTSEVYDDKIAGNIVLVNGHSLKGKKSTNTNLALLVSITLPDVENPMEYCRNIARNVNAIAKGNPIVQRLADIKEGRRTWQDELQFNSIEPTLKTANPGDLSLCMPYREMTDILNFIEMVDKVAPGFANGDNLLYGPEIKFYSNKVELTNSLETSVNGLYAIGDGCGLTRGLMMASASGYYLSQKI